MYFIEFKSLVFLGENIIDFSSELFFKMIRFLTEILTNCAAVEKKLMLIR